MTTGSSAIMRIAIIGSGNLGSALGHRWAAHGHEVVFGLRDLAQGASAVKGGLPAGARAASLPESVSGAAVVVLATPAAAVEAALRTISDALEDTVVVDATNPVGAGLMLMTGPDGESQAEQTAALLATIAPART